MSIRKKIAQSLRTTFASVVLAGSAATLPILGGYVGYDAMVDDFDNSSNKVSAQSYQTYATNIQNLSRQLEEWNALGEAAEAQQTPDKVHQLINARHKVEDSYIQNAELLSANILTNTDLTEKDYKRLRDDFVRLRDGNVKDDNFYLPRKFYAFDESQDAVFFKGKSENKKADAKKIRQNMEDATSENIDFLFMLASILGAFGAVASVVNFRPERVLANRIEKGVLTRSRLKKN